MCAAVLGVVAGWAAFAPPTVEHSASPEPTYKIADATVGRSATFTVDASWPQTDLGVSAGSGTVTTVAVAPGQVVDQGDTLYTLDLRPVVIARGDVPSFRDLGPGSSGPDVAQLQQLLVDRGHLRGRPDAAFSARTTAAVKAWQRSLGVEPTGDVRAADLIFAATLPTRVVLADDIRIGAQADPGDVTVRSVADAPRLTVTIDSRSEVPPVGTPVVVTYGEAGWEGVIGALGAGDGDQAQTVADLTAADGSPICASACADIPLDVARGSLTAQVEQVPTVVGPAVPVSALGTAADGSAFVLSGTGDRLPVTVEVTDGSRAVVTGVAAGDEIRLFAIPEPAPTTAAAP